MCGTLSNDGVSTLTYGEVRRAAVALHGSGTKVRIFHDGSGYILPPPPYREEENLYGFDHEFQLRGNCRHLLRRNCPALPDGSSG